MATTQSASRADAPLAANGTPGATERNVELEDMSDAPPKLPVEEDIMQLARLGEIGAIQKLFDSGKFDATYRDEQGITPLHVSLLVFLSDGVMRQKLTRHSVGRHQ